MMQRSKLDIVFFQETWKVEVEKKQNKKIQTRVQVEKRQNQVESKNWK